MLRSGRSGLRHRARSERACDFGAAPAQRVSGAKFGIQDDAWLMYGPGTLDERLTTLDGLGVAGRPVHAALGSGRADAAGATRATRHDPAYRWGAVR